MTTGEAEDASAAEKLNRTAGVSCRETSNAGNFGSLADALSRLAPSNTREKSAFMSGLTFKGVATWLALAAYLIYFAVQFHLGLQCSYFAVSGQGDLFMGFQISNLRFQIEKCRVGGLVDLVDGMD